MKKLHIMFARMIQRIRVALKLKNTLPNTTPPDWSNTTVQNLKKLSPEKRQQAIQEWLKTPMGIQYAQQLKTQYLEQMYLQLVQKHQQNQQEPELLAERLMSSLALHQLVKLEQENQPPVTVLN